MHRTLAAASSGRSRRRRSAEAGGHGGARDDRRDRQELRFARPMGTTVVAVLLVRDTAVVASVGDSRAYLMLGGRYLRITRDHTLANQYAELGLIPRSAVRGHPLRNVLARVVGSPPASSPTCGRSPLPPGSRLLLCTDGLSEMVEEEETMRILRDAPDPQSGAAELVDSALRGGGRDNVTVIVVEREEDVEVVGNTRCAEPDSSAGQEPA